MCKELLGNGIRGNSSIKNLHLLTALRGKKNK